MVLLLLGKAQICILIRILVYLVQIGLTRAEKCVCLLSGLHVGFRICSSLLKLHLLLLLVLYLNLDTCSMVLRVLLILGERNLRRCEYFRGETLLAVLFHPVVILGHGLILESLLYSVSTISYN